MDSGFGSTAESVLGLLLQTRVYLILSWVMDLRPGSCRVNLLRISSWSSCVSLSCLILCRPPAVKTDAWSYHVSTLYVEDIQRAAYWTSSRSVIHVCSLLHVTVEWRRRSGTLETEKIKNLMPPTVWRSLIDEIWCAEHVCIGSEHLF
jgi:hypothetical protein